MIFKLLSLPKDLVRCFSEIEHLYEPEWYCNSDPENMKVGSGGGTTYLLDNWLADVEGAKISDKKIIIHAGGQSRRLPSYAPVGKILTPIPVFRWARGQKLNQNLLSLQLPLYEQIIERAPEKLKTLVASGDVLVRADSVPEIPDADVVCFGTWVDATLATHHGVFVSKRETPGMLDFMLQKPSLEELEKYSGSHFFQMDTGIWLFSERAMEVLSMKSKEKSGNVKFYDLYGEFGLALGENPSMKDSDVSRLSVAIVTLPGGEFHHFGTSAELISSTLELQNIVKDQRKILHTKIKPNASLFVQNALMGYRLSDKNDRVWIENSNIPAGWTLRDNHVITGVPVNDWDIDVESGTCIDIIPLVGGGFAVRPYGIGDKMSGALHDEETTWMGRSFRDWTSERGVEIEGCNDDIQFARIFPVVKNLGDMETVLKWMISNSVEPEGKQIWTNSEKISAAEISEKADLKALYKQREKYRKENWEFLAQNHEKSVFYQLDLLDAADNFVDLGLEAPARLDQSQPSMKRAHNHILRSAIGRKKGYGGEEDETMAFGLLREEILRDLEEKTITPRLSVQSDQIVWGRSPVRIDLAGGWTDTPPYSLFSGGSVVNVAIELNGQQPLQVYVKPSEEMNITLRSIDLGATETVESFEGLHQFFTVGSPFSIPKAALYLSGFRKRYEKDTLTDFLRDFGSGIEITLMSAIPSGSGLGTSSILAATVLGALSDFCGLALDDNEICNRTLALEQLLTTGGGWQDQYGGVLPGVKFLQTQDGFNQIPTVSWLPEQIFTAEGYNRCHLLYYTGLRRVAKGILADIVRGMFLNSGIHLSQLQEMKAHALTMAETIQRNDFEKFGKLVKKTWEQNKRLDTGTEPTEIRRLISLIDDLSLGYKLPGAGGGGYLYVVAKDPDAALEIRKILTENAPNDRARFVDMTLSNTGFRVTRS